MMAIQFIAGASLFALLIVDVCCWPLKGGNPEPYYGGYANAADFKQGAPSAQFSPGAAPSGVSAFYQPALEEPSFSQPAVHRQPAVSVGSPSAPVSGPGAASQPGPREIAWAVAPQSFFSGSEEVPAGVHVASSRPENVSPPLPPPGPEYQAGELSQYEQNVEYGDYQRETEDQGYLPPPPPPMLVSSERGYTSPSQPQARGWGPYPYYDYMFLTGQYPPGTVTHSSSSYEQGHDSWQDSHYVRYHGPYDQVPQQTETFSPDLVAPQIVKAPRQPVKSAVKQ
ncbi:hypothetical protein D9C73_006410 [Collichthys lucidus]|uniref:Uncharacterized protein n=1 Tax=Collichthys lucidus TaxID=240159 RepID=A0A4U5UCT9_COLLU|nr:hypothetical protein D9C73_006410 [Collichthys lucidus]